MISQPIGLWLAPCRFRTRSETCARLSRLLLLLIAVELVTMPLTQHLWTWDGFLHGGQDFELGLFMTVVCICLVLLRAQHGRQLLPLLFVTCRRVLRFLGGWRFSQVNRTGEVTGEAGRLRNWRSRVVLTTPLLI